MDGYLRRLVLHGEGEGFAELPICNAVCCAEGILPLAVVLEERAMCISGLVRLQHEAWHCHCVLVTPYHREVDSFIRQAFDERCALQEISVFDLNTLLWRNYETSESCLDKADKCFGGTMNAKCRKLL